MESKKLSSETSTQSIFIKQSDLKRDEHKLNYQEILKSIPDDKYDTEQFELQKTNHEWRWRFFSLGDKKMIEISICTPATINNNGEVIERERKYINKYGKWVSRNVDPLFDKYVTKQYFYYTNAIE